MTEKITAKHVLAAIRKKHHQDAVVREVVIDDFFEWGFRYREQADRHLAQSTSSEDHHARWAKRDLDYARARGWIVPDALPEGWSRLGSVPRRRIDALIFASTGITAIEIKVSRADFKRETEEKRRAWRAVTNRFVYAAPAGLLDPSGIPAGCGLWEFDHLASGPYLRQHGLTAKVKARVNKEPLPMPAQILTALAYRVSKNERKEEA